jgi:ATP-dependent Clp protease ATP-binding subunit ClpA
VHSHDVALWQVHHGIRISDGAIVAAATLANRYLTHRHMPDKAIDLIDEACSSLRLQQARAASNTSFGVCKGFMQTFYYFAGEYARCN